MARFRRRRPRLGRPPLGAPPREPAVEDGDRVVAEGAEGPPHARGAHDPARVVHDHAVTVADAKPAHVPRERRGAGEHVRERGAGVGDHVDVEEDRARDVRLGELGPRVAAELRHVPRAVDHADVPPTQVGGEPLGGDERRGRAAHRMVL